MKFEKHKTLKNVMLFYPESSIDYRGEYLETFNYNVYDSAFPQRITFVQDDFSFSSKGVLRGLHGDDKTWKLVTCVKGGFLLTIIDCREKSPTFKEADQFYCNDKNRLQVLIPPGFANGHLCMTQECVFHYKQSEYYSPGTQWTVAWNDPVLAKQGLSWPVKDPILSKRDSKGPFRILVKL